MDENNFRTLLRAELNIPGGLTPNERVAALEAAFRSSPPYSFYEPFEPCRDTALVYLPEGDDVDFFGLRTMHAAFGEDLGKNALGAGHPSPRGGDWMEGMRTRTYRYAVVGYEKYTLYQRTRERVVSIVLRLTSHLLYQEAAGPLAGPVETLKLRSGLMNKVQATLLADHLNSMQGGPRYKSRTTWRVETGPEPDASARDWLDALDPIHPLMRRESGEAAAWDLGEVATHSIATYRMEEGLTLSPSQVFSVHSPRIILPARYLLDCWSPDGKTVYMAADAYSGVGVRRSHPCPAAATLCELITGSNLRMADCPTPSEQEAVCGFYYDDERGPHYDLSQYALGLTKEEAEQVSNYLTASGYGMFELARIGHGGNFNPLGFNDEYGVGKLVVPGTTPLEVEFFTHRG